MISSGLKLLFGALAGLGPFFAGFMIDRVVEPEIYAFFFLFGIGLGLAGLFGFAGLERDEGVRHARNLRREG